MGSDLPVDYFVLLDRMGSDLPVDYSFSSWIPVRTVVAIGPVDDDVQVIVAVVVDADHVVGAAVVDAYYSHPSLLG